jgi:hypothetical protein
MAGYNRQSFLGGYTMSQSDLGRLEQVELRSIWANEAGDFTPWLAQNDNLRLLGDTIGIELELEAQEKAVGPFSADILCKDTSDGSWVLIENQLERTDHTHLGQLLTYAAGLQAVTIVWIARRLTEEHRAALDWLNEITDEKFRFFGLEIEVWKIGNSIAAPKFNIVSNPNDWFRTVAANATRLNRAEMTDAKKLQLDFWTAFVTYCNENQTSFFSQHTPQPQTWMSFHCLGRSGFHLSGIASHWDSVTGTGNHEIRAELYIDGINAKFHYQALEDQRDEIESNLGQELTWLSRENVRSCRLHTRKQVDLTDRNRWLEYHQWLANELDKFNGVFGPIVRNLEP